MLEVDPDASQGELKAAHRRLVRLHHPDLQPAEHRPGATRRVQRINVAYALVRDPQSRARYDRLRRAHLLRARAISSQQHAHQRIADADRLLGAQWQELSIAAGRWAGDWWRRNRGRARRAGRRARLAGLDLLGRVLWVLSCLVGAIVGLVITLAFQRLAAADGSVIPAAGLLAGGLVGSRRGWRRRLRLAGLPAPRSPGLETVLAVLLLLVAVLLEIRPS